MTMLMRLTAAAPRASSGSRHAPLACLGLLERATLEKPQAKGEEKLALSYSSLEFTFLRPRLFGSY